MAKLILFSFFLPIIIYYANTLPVEINTNSLATINMKMNILKFPKEVGKLRKLLKDCDIGVWSTYHSHTHYVSPLHCNISKL